MPAGRVKFHGVWDYNHVIKVVEFDHFKSEADLRGYANPALERIYSQSSVIRQPCFVFRISMYPSSESYVRMERIWWAVRAWPDSESRTEIRLRPQ